MSQLADIRTERRSVAALDVASAPTHAVLVDIHAQPLHTAVLAHRGMELAALPDCRRTVHGRRKLPAAKAAVGVETYSSS
jgi:hypothetical protein